MNNQVRLYRNRQKLDAVFLRVEELAKQEPDSELQADLARYLCVLSSGYLEVCISLIMSGYCKTKSSTQVARFCESQLARPMNLKTEKILTLIGRFDPSWRTQTEKTLLGPRKDAIDSVVALRNKIVHGDSVGITLATIREYYQRIKESIDFIAGLFNTAAE